MYFFRANHKTQKNMNPCIFDAKKVKKFKQGGFFFIYSYLNPPHQSYKPLEEPHAQISMRFKQFLHLFQLLHKNDNILKMIVQDTLFFLKKTSLKTWPDNFFAFPSATRRQDS